jgi:hypothetical protein
MDFGKITLAEKHEDGTVHLVEQGFYNGLNTVIESRRQDISITRDTILTEIINCLDLVKHSDSEVNIRIVKDKHNEPLLLQKTWIVKRDKIK